MTKHIKRHNCLSDGYSDNLKPVTPLDLSKVESVNDLVTQMGNTAFGGRAIGEITKDFIHNVHAIDPTCACLFFERAKRVEKLREVMCINIFIHFIIPAKQGCCRI